MEIDAIEDLPAWTLNCRNVRATAVVVNRLLHEYDGEVKAHTYTELQRHHDADNEQLPGTLVESALDELVEEGIVESFGGYYWPAESQRERARDLVDVVRPYDRD